MSSTQANKHESLRPRSVLVPTNLVSTKDGVTVRLNELVHVGIEYNSAFAIL